MGIIKESSWFRQDHYIKKYSSDAINEALRDWEISKNIVPLEKSIPSRLLNYTLPRNVNSNLIYVTYKDVQKYFRHLQHWYIEINEKYKWDPGSLNNKIFTQINSEPSSLTKTTATDNADVKLARIIEMCNHCTYWYFYDKFIKDSFFDTFLYNCEIITGFRVETLLIWTSFVSLIIFFISQYYFFLFLFVLVLLIFFVAVNKTIDNEIQIELCPHIQCNYKNIAISKEHSLL